VSEELNTTGAAKYSDFGPIDGYTSEMVQIGGKLVLIANRKTHMSFLHIWYENRWPWMTLNGLTAIILRYFSKLVYDVYDHIKTICAIIQRLFGQNKLITWFDACRCI